jgi:uncharacterized membrane protein (DUF373 family)
LPRSWVEIRRNWTELTAYQRFESLVAFALRFIIAAVIVVALYRLVARVVDTLVLRALDPLEHDVFQQVFGSIMTLLIALEFSHTLQSALAALTLSLGVTYWLMRHRDEHAHAAEESVSPPPVQSKPV